ncbi:hypothetical protein HYH03_006592 [Edaphochlamys debaryana]|uniref:Uncharacterized protein n=1 Tax=Edaphochlamys debaryana TaxID=47281 RepID=A0A835Y557_9CHLO|nr:hypothetical protein HYH03_006592 [Edaphochlamys debaryana]|eukprot:KAG2495322.1 hypothetical protein HYH03_006592 [Edaphochlamys debaryana]
MDSEEEQQGQRPRNLSQAPQAARKSVNWARKRPTDEGATKPRGAAESPTTGYSAAPLGVWREGAISPLERAASVASATSFARPESGHGAGGTRSRRMSGNLSRRSSLGQRSSMTGGWNTDGGESSALDRSSLPPGYRIPSAARLSAAPSHLPPHMVPPPGSVTSARPGTSDTYGTQSVSYNQQYAPYTPPMSPSKVGLSARQRAMLDASQVGTFRFARVQRAGEGVDRDRDASPSALASPTSPSLPLLALSSIAMSGMVPNPSSPFRATAQAVMAANRLQPAPRRGPKGPHTQPPAALGALLQHLNESAQLGNAPQPPGFSTSPSAAHSLHGGDMSHRSEGSESSLAAPAWAPQYGGAAQSYVPLGRAAHASPGMTPVTRTDVFASFIRPGRPSVPQPGLMAAPNSTEPDMTDAEALLYGGTVAGGRVRPGAREDFDQAAAMNSVLDEELAPLLKEVAEINVRPSVRAALGKLDDRAIKMLFAATSRRVEHLPCTPVAMSSGGGLLLPLPGPKGVPGFKVNSKGQIHSTTQIGHYLSSLEHAGGRGAAGAGGGGAGGPVRRTGSGSGHGSPHHTLSGGLSSEFSFLQQLLEQDPEALSPKTRSLLTRFGPQATREIIEAAERERAAAAAAAATPPGPAGSSAVSYRRAGAASSSPRRGALAPPDGPSGGTPTTGRKGGLRAATKSGTGAQPSSSDSRVSLPAFAGAASAAAVSASGQGHTVHHIPRPDPLLDEEEEGEEAEGDEPMGEAGRGLELDGASSGEEGSLDSLERLEEVGLAEDVASQEDSPAPGQGQGERAGSPGAALSVGFAPTAQVAVGRSGGKGGKRGGRPVPVTDLRTKFGRLSNPGGAAAGGGGGGGTGSGGAPTSGRSGRATDRSTVPQDPIEARRLRLGKLMADLESEHVDDAELARYAPFIGLDDSDNESSRGPSRASHAAGPGSGPAVRHSHSHAHVGSGSHPVSARQTAAVTARLVARASEVSVSCPTLAASLAERLAADRGSDGQPYGSSGVYGGGEPAESDDEDDEDRGVTDEQLGLPTPDQMLAALGPGATASDALFARLEHGMKRRAALRQRRAAREEAARRRAAEDASRYVEVDLGSEDDDLAAPLAAGARRAVAAVRRHGPQGREELLLAKSGLDTWPSLRAHPERAAAAAGHASATATPAPLSTATSMARLHTQLSSASGGSLSQALAAIGADGTPIAPNPDGAGGGTPPPEGATSGDTAPPGAGSEPGALAPADGADPNEGQVLASPHQPPLTPTSGEEAGGAGAGSPGTADGGGVTSGPAADSPAPHLVWYPSGGGVRSVSPNAAAAGGTSARGRVVGGAAGRAYGLPASVPYSFASERQRAKLEPMFDNWQVAAGPDPQLMALGAFKEALLPGDAGPPPQELKAFAPLPGEPVKVTAAQVSRRLAQMGEVGSTTLDLDFGPRLTRGDLGVVFAAIKDLPPPCVTGLRATDGAMTSSAVDGLVPLLRNCPGVEEVDLRGNLSLDASALSCLAPLLHSGAGVGAGGLHRGGLRVLDLSGCARLAEGAAGAAGFGALLAALAQNRGLQSLRLSGCGLTDACLALFERCLASNTGLRALDLSRNAFSAAGINALCRDLEDNRSLRWLSLASCSLGDACAPPLERLLAAHPALRHLDLAHNNLAWKGADALASGLTPRPEQLDPALGLPALRSLALDGNPLGQAGVLAVLRLLLANTRLRSVSLAGVSLTPVPGEPLDLDPAHPNGHYSLDLADTEQRKAAVTLVALWSASSGSSWVSASLDGQPLHLPRAAAGGAPLPARLRWPDAMPARGQLVVSVRNNASLDPALAGPPPSLDPAPKRVAPSQAQAQARPPLGGPSFGGASTRPVSVMEGGRRPSGTGPSYAGSTGPGGAPLSVRSYEYNWDEQYSPRSQPTSLGVVAGLGGRGVSDSGGPPGASEGGGVTGAGEGGTAPGEAGGGTEAGGGHKRVRVGEGDDDPSSAVLTTSLMTCLEAALEGPAGSEVWKTQLLTLATKVSYISACQAGRLLSRLRYRSERADAAATLLSAVPDLHRAPWALSDLAGFGPDDIAELLQELSLAPLLPLRTRVVNGWDACCSGHIKLDLAQQSHRFLAILLVQRAVRGSGASQWSTPQAAEPIEDLFGAATARLGDATACMRAITFGGAPLGHSVIYLSSANIPVSGTLEMQFVNVRPRKHIDYPGLGLGKQRRQAPSILSGKTPAPPPLTASPTKTRLRESLSASVASGIGLGDERSRGAGAVTPSASAPVNFASASGLGLPGASPIPGTAGGSPAPGTSGPSDAASPSASRPRTPQDAEAAAAGTGPGTAAGTTAPSPEGSPSTADAGGGGGAGAVSRGATRHPSVSGIPSASSAGGAASSAAAAAPVGAAGLLAMRRHTMFASGPPPAVGANIVAMEAVRLAASYLSTSLALNATFGKKNWWTPYLTAWEGLYMEALLRLGLPHDHPAIAGWRQAGAMWKSSAYRCFSVRLHEEVAERHEGYTLGAGGTTKRQSGHTGEDGAGEPGAATARGKVKGKDGKKSARGAAEASGGEESGGRRGKAGKGGKAGAKGGKGGRAGGGTHDGHGSHGWGPGHVDSATLRLLGAVDNKARHLAPLMVDMACQISMSCHMVMHLLRLLPDFDLRLRVLVALWPCIWDRGNVIDLVLDLDHPIAVPLLHKKSTESMPITATVSHHPSGEHPPGNHAAALRASATSPVPGAGNSPKRNSGPDHGMGAGGGAGGGAGAASVPTTPASPHHGDHGPPLLRPRGFTPSPHSGDELLLRVAGALGWRSLALPWSTPGCLAGLTLHLHLGAIDQLQAVAALCRFADRCYSATGVQVITALACDGAMLDLEEAVELRGGVWELVLARTVLCLDRPEYGTVSMQLGGITADAQRAVAAVTIQAVWRGYLVRRSLRERVLEEAGGSAWRRAAGLARHLRRLASMRTLAADLDISRAQGAMERGYLRMLYGPNAA